MSDPRGTIALVADRLTVHHERFLAAIEAGGWRAEPVVLRSSAPLRDSLTALAPDAILAGPVPDVGAAAVGAAGAVPVVLTSWGSDLLHDVQVDPAARARAVDAIAAAAGIVVDCHAVERVALELGADPATIARLPWGVDLARNPFRPPAPRPSGPLRVVSLRTLAPAYRVDVLVRALVHVPEVAATLAGGGPEEESLLSLAQRLGVEDRVRVVGRIPEADVAELLHDHDVHVSTAPVDGSSVSLLQAMACGRPSVVTDHAANREWIEEGRTGWLVPAGDVEALAAQLDALAHAAGGPTLAAVANAARLRVEHDADWDRNRVRIWDLLARVTERID